MQKILKYAVLGGLFLVPFIPFIVPQGMFFPFITGKGFTFRILVEVIFGLFVILAVLEREYRPKLSWITKAVLLFTVAIFISDLLSVNPYKSLWSNYERMEGFVLIFHLLLYYIVVSSFFTKSLWNSFLNTSIVASLIMSFYGVLQLAGKLTINQGGVRLDGTFGNASYFAIYLVFHIFLCLYFLVDRAKKKWLRITYGLIALFETGILYFTATRGAILGLGLGLLLVGILLAWKERQNAKLRKLSYGLLGAIVLFVVLFFSLRNTAFVQHSPVLSRFSHLSVAEFQTQGRYFVWPMAFKGFIEHPIFGWGQESFNFVFNKYYDPRMYGQEQWFDRTHDIFLDWLIAGGLVGFMAYISMYIAFFYYIWRKQSKLGLPEKSIITGMIAAYLFHNIFVFDNLISYILFFSILAYVHTISTEGPREGKFYTKVISPDVTAYVIAPVVIILTVLGVYYINVPAIKANKTLIQAITPQTEGPTKNLALFKEVYALNSFGSTEATEQLISITSQLTSDQVPASIRDEFYNFTKEKVEEKVKETPHDARYLVFAGSFYDRFGKYDEAIKKLNLAIAESPKKQTIYYELGTSYIGKGELPKAFETFEKAYQLDKTSPESKIIYAIGAIYTKNAEVLKQLSSQIDPNIVINDNRILQAYANIGDYGTVIKILSARLEKDPNNSQYLLSLASAYASSGQKQKAIDIINSMIQKDPNFKTQGEGYIKQIQGF